MCVCVCFTKISTKSIWFFSTILFTSCRPSPALEFLGKYKPPVWVTNYYTLFRSTDGKEIIQSTKRSSLEFQQFRGVGKYLTLGRWETFNGRGVQTFLTWDWFPQEYLRFSFRSAPVHTKNLTINLNNNKQEAHGPDVHLRKQFKSINTYDYFIRLI